MSAAFTPGPWAVSKRPTAKDGIEHADGFVAFVAIPRTVSDERLADESWLDMRQRTEGARIAVMAEQEANARLIAAAPELLAALQDLADLGSDTLGKRHPFVQAAFAAIDKATGAAS